ncbi:MAG: hypothetical protein HRU31_02830 [Rhodobacteraceae bacterium]|nr:hypothetical protein [Paracoccaceae bacterium]
MSNGLSAVLGPLVPLVIPVVGGLVTLITARMGLGGRIRKIDLLKARLELTTALLDRGEADEALRQLLRLQVNDIIVEMLPDYGDLRDLADLSLDAQGERQGEVTPIPPAWSDFGLLRRWIFLPVSKTFFGWTAIVFYYYMMLATIGGAITVLNPAPEDEAFVTDMTLGLFVLALVTVGIGLWAKNIYVRARQRMLDQQYARQHLSTLFAAAPERKEPT